MEVRYVCPNCKEQISYIRYDSENASAFGVTVFCKKCKKVVPLTLRTKKIETK